MASEAGKYDSVLGVAGSEAVTAAIGRVIDSFGDGQTEGDQIFVQPMLDRVAMAGVAFSRNPSGGGPYFVINYDDRSGLTNRVTAGVGEDLKTFLLSQIAHRCRARVAGAGRRAPGRTRNASRL